MTGPTAIGPALILGLWFAVCLVGAGDDRAPPPFRPRAVVAKGLCDAAPQVRGPCTRQSSCRSRGEVGFEHWRCSPLAPTAADWQVEVTVAPWCADTLLLTAGHEPTPNEPGTLVPAAAPGRWSLPGRPWRPMVLWPMRDGARSGPPAVLVYVGARGMDATWGDLLPWVCGLSLASSALFGWLRQFSTSAGRLPAAVALALSAAALATRPAAIGGWDEQGWGLLAARFAVCFAVVTAGAWASATAWSRPQPAPRQVVAAVAGIALAAVGTHVLLSDANQPADRNVLEYKNLYYGAVAALLAAAPGQVAAGGAARGGAISFAVWASVLTGAAITLGDGLAGQPADHLIAGFFKPLSGWTLVAALTPAAWATAHLAGRARMWRDWALKLQDRLLRCDWAGPVIEDPLPALGGDAAASTGRVQQAWQRVAAEAPALAWLGHLRSAVPAVSPRIIAAIERRWSRTAPLLLMAPDGAVVSHLRLRVLPWPVLGRLVVHARWNGLPAPTDWRDAAAAVVELGWRAESGAGLGSAWVTIDVEVDTALPVAVDGDSWQLCVALLAFAVAHDRPWPVGCCASGGVAPDGTVTAAADLVAKASAWQQKHRDGIVWASPDAPPSPGIARVTSLAEIAARWPSG